MKCCKNCGLEKELKEFRKYRNDCRKCEYVKRKGLKTTLYAREYKRKNAKRLRKKNNIASKKYYDKNKAKYAFKYKCKRLQKKIKFLTFEEYERLMKNKMV